MVKYKVSMAKFNELVKESEWSSHNKAGQDSKGYYILYTEDLMDDVGYYTGEFSEGIVYGKKADDSLIFDLEKIKFSGKGARDINSQENNFYQLYYILEDVGKETTESPIIIHKKYGKKGWRQESARHALASKGIKTGRKGKESEAGKDWSKMVKRIKRTPIYSQEEMRTMGLKPFTISKLKKARKGEF